MNTTPTIVTVPCLSGTPWKLEQLSPLHDHSMSTTRQPEAATERREL